MKRYTTKQAAKILKTTQRTLLQLMRRDQQRPKDKQYFPNTEECECGHGSFWLVDCDLQKYIENHQNKA